MNDKCKTDLIEEYSCKIKDLQDEVGKIVLGQNHMKKSLVLALMSDGHILLEGVPGLAKSLVVETAAKAIEGKFQRIQFTPDLMPSDITGSAMLNLKTNEFYTDKGPIFNNLVLADEINRASPKVQSALLQAMQEREVSIERTTHKLDRPFLVLATMNPLEQAGTYPLSEAQVDRFMLKIDVHYPSMNHMDELLYLKHTNFEQAKNEVKKAMDLDDIIQVQKLVHESIQVDNRVRTYINNLWINSQPPHTRNRKDVSNDDFKSENWVLNYDLIKYGSSPRGAENLQKVSKSYAFMEGRDFVTCEDVAYVAKDILRHRIMMNPSAERENVTADDMVEELLAKTPLPSYGAKSFSKKVVFKP